MCIPAGDPPGLLFKHLFLHKLPGNLRDQVAKKMERLDARELAEYADTRWHVRNTKKGPGKSGNSASSSPAEWASPAGRHR